MFTVIYSLSVYIIPNFLQNSEHWPGTCLKSSTNEVVYVKHFFGFAISVNV